MTTTAALPRPVNPRRGPLAFRPVMPLLNRLGLSAKLTLIAVVLMVPLLLLLTQMVLRANVDLAYTRTELVGTHVGHKLLDLADAVQGMRGLNLTAASGNAGAEKELASTAAELGKTLAEVDQAVVQSALGLDKDWAPLRTQVAALSGKVERDDKAFARYSALVSQLHDFVTLTSEKSGLLLDPDGPTFMLMDIAYDRMSHYNEALAQVQSAAAAAAAKAQPTTDDRLAMGLAQRALAAGRHAVQLRLDALTRTGEAVPTGWAEANAAIDALQAQAQTVPGGSTAQRNAESSALFKAGEDTLTKLDTFHNAAVHRLDELLQARAQRIEHDRAQLMAVAAGGVLLALYLFLATASAIRRAASAVLTTADAVAAGNMDQDLPVEGHDELARIGQAFTKVQQTLRQLVADMNTMSVEHDAGQTDARIDQGRFAGSYRTMAEGVNGMVDGHIAMNRMAMGVVGEFGHGNFDAPLAQLPGKKALVNETIERVRGNLKGLIAQMNHMSSEHDLGDIDITIDASRFQGDFRTMAEGVNNMVAQHITVKRKALHVMSEFGRGISTRRWKHSPARRRSSTRPSSRCGPTSRP